MTTTNSTAITNILDAHDLLSETEFMVSFVQSITIINPKNDAELSLTSDQVSGLYYVLKNIRNNLNNIGEKIYSARTELCSNE